MALSNPPKYRYPLNDQWDKDTFELIKSIGISKQLPRIIGSQSDIDLFLKTLIRTQKALHDWRQMPVDIVDQIRKDNTISPTLLNEKYPPESIGKDVPAWVTYHEDRTVSGFIDDLNTRQLNFIGSNYDASEFVTRFLLGQLGNDWEFTIFMIWEMLGDDKEIKLKDLNKELRNFDYCKLLF